MADYFQSVLTKAVENRENLHNASGNENMSDDFNEVSSYKMLLDCL